MLCHWWGRGLGRRDAIQPCPLSKILDDSPSLQSWEHFLCGLIQARGTLARTATAAPLTASATTRAHLSCTQEIQADTHKCQQ